MHNDWTTVPANYSDVLRRAMESLFKTFENLSEGTFIVDADARVVWINKRYAARFGFSDPADAIGRDCEAVIPHSLMREVVMTGKPILLDVLETDREPLVVTRLPLKDDARRDRRRHRLRAFRRNEGAHAAFRALLARAAGTDRDAPVARAGAAREVHVRELRRHERGEP